jgi:hypothetical protein
VASLPPQPWRLKRAQKRRLIRFLMHDEAGYSMATIAWLACSSEYLVKQVLIEDLAARTQFMA